MPNDEKSDNLVVKTHHHGVEAGLSQGDQAMLEIDPEGITITRGLANRFPPPEAEAAKLAMDRIFVAHGESDGPLIVGLSEEFRSRFGWHPRVEWWRILGLEIVNAPNLVEAQQELLATFEQAKSGQPPPDAVPTEEPIRPETWDWALGANALNLMEWLWKAERWQESLDQFEPSLRGLAPTDDTGRWIERSLYKASCEVHLARAEDARATLAAAFEKDPQEFQRLWALYRPKMKELENLINRL